jgi:hypothetical protein
MEEKKAAAQPCSRCVPSVQSAVQPVEQLCEKRSVQDHQRAEERSALQVMCSRRSNQPRIACDFSSVPNKPGGLRRGHVSLLSLGSKPTHIHLYHDASCVFFSFFAREWSKSTFYCRYGLPFWSALDLYFHLAIFLKCERSHIVARS